MNFKLVAITALLGVIAPSTMGMGAIGRYGRGLEACHLVNVDSGGNVRHAGGATQGIGGVKNYVGDNDHVVDGAEGRWTFEAGKPINLKLLVKGESKVAME